MQILKVVIKTLWMKSWMSPRDTAVNLGNLTWRRHQQSRRQPSIAFNSPAGPGAGRVQTSSQDGLPTERVDGHQGEQAHSLPLLHRNLSCFVVGVEELMLQQDK